MKNASAQEFVDNTTYQEVAVRYKGVKYFFHGVIYDKEKKVYTYDIAIWDKNNQLVKYVLEEEYRSPTECLEKGLKEPVFDGKSFWEAESEMEWVEW